MAHIDEGRYFLLAVPLNIAGAEAAPEEVQTDGDFEEAPGSGEEVGDFSTRCQLDHGADCERQVSGHAPEGETV